MWTRTLRILMEISLQFEINIQHKNEMIRQQTEKKLCLYLLFRTIIFTSSCGLQICRLQPVICESMTEASKLLCLSVCLVKAWNHIRVLNPYAYLILNNDVRCAAKENIIHAETWRIHKPIPLDEFLENVQKSLYYPKSLKWCYCKPSHTFRCLFLSGKRL